MFLISLCSCGHAGRRYVYLHCHMNVQSGTFATKGMVSKSPKLNRTMHIAIYVLHYAFYIIWGALEDLFFLITPWKVKDLLWYWSEDGYISQALDNAIWRKRCKRQFWKSVQLVHASKTGYERCNSIMIHMESVRDSGNERKLRNKNLPYFLYRDWSKA